MEIKNKQELVDNLKAMFSDMFNQSLSGVNMSEEEKNANILLSKKKIQADSEQIANLVFQAYGV